MSYNLFHGMATDEVAALASSRSVVAHGAQSTQGHQDSKIHCHQGLLASAGGSGLLKI